MNEILEFPKKLKKIEKISPSYYNSLKKCKLMSLLDYNKVSLSLPNSPQVYWGSIVHDLLKKAVRGRFENNQKISQYHRDTQITYWNSTPSRKQELLKTFLKNLFFF